METLDEAAPLNKGEAEAEAEAEADPEPEPEPVELAEAEGLGQGVEVFTGLVLVGRAEEGGGVTLDRVGMVERVELLAVVVC